MAKRREKWKKVGPRLWINERMGVMGHRLPSGHAANVHVMVRDGRLVAEEVSVRVVDSESGPVTGEVLRTVPVASLVRECEGMVWVGDEPPADDISDEAFLESIWAHTFSNEVAARLAANGPTQETLEAVAQVYQLAYLVGAHPTQAVEGRFRLPRSTAGRWVSLARKRGFLGEAPRPGKAGA